MRIRKRFLSLSAAARATPPSDAPLLVQHQQLHPNPPSSSDHTTQIGQPPAASDPNKTDKDELESDRKLKEIVKIADTGCCRKESILCAQANSHDDLGMFTLMKPNKPKKKKIYDEKSGKQVVIMEPGSRCSRVNGRGWRCSQQTLVGYSLCQHHLGKGRLRSMTSSSVIRGSKKQDERTKESQDYKEADKATSVGPHEEFEEEDEDEVESMSSMEVERERVSKMRKLGMVKARSLSSLLSQL